MADKVEMVKLPKAVFDELEERSVRLTHIETELGKHDAVLRQFEITAVITRPASGPQAAAVLAAAKDVWNIATLYGEKNG